MRVYIVKGGVHWALITVILWLIIKEIDRYL